MNAVIRTFILVSAAASSVWADASYTETVHYDGGTLIDMVKAMSTGPMGKMMGDRIGQAFQDQTSMVYLKGNKMARLGPVNSSITDLDAGTVTTINNTKKTYTVMTFDELKQMAAGRPGRAGGDYNLDFDVKVDKTGNTKMIDGQTATEYLMTMTQKDPGAGGGIKVVSHFWLAKSEPGGAEVTAYYKKVAEQYKDAFSGGANPMMGGAMKAMAAANAKLGSMDGVAVETHMEISGVQSAMGPMAQQQGDPNAPALMLTTQNKGYSDAGVDDSKFSIPAGYQKVDRPMGGRRGRPSQDQ